MPAIYKASTECRDVYVYECTCLLLFCFSRNPLNDLKGGNYCPHFAVDDPKFREVKWLADVPAACKQLRPELNPGVPRAKAQVLSPSWTSGFPNAFTICSLNHSASTFFCLWPLTSYWLLEWKEIRWNQEIVFSSFPLMDLNGSYLY